MVVWTKKLCTLRVKEYVNLQYLLERPYRFTISLIYNKVHLTLINFNIQVENLVKKVDGNIAAEGGAVGGGPIDSELAKITDKIKAVESKIDGAAGVGGGDLAAPVSSFMGSEMYKLEVFFYFYNCL